MHLLSLFNISLKQSTIFDLVLARAALLGVGWRSGFSSYKVYPTYDTDGIFPLVSFFIKVRRPTPFDFGKSWGLCSVLRDSP